MGEASEGELTLNNFWAVNFPVSIWFSAQKSLIHLFCSLHYYQMERYKIVFALMTEWRQFRMPSWNVIKKVMTGNIIIDGRNIYDRQELEELGFVYTRVGEK